MAKDTVLMGLFNKADHTANTVEALEKMGIADDDVAILSGIPYPAEILGRPLVWERIPVIALSGAVIGFLIGIFLVAGTPQLYPVHVGGQGLLPIPPLAVITYELTMLGIIVSTFLGVLWESFFPSYGPKRYDRLVTEGHIGILLRCTPEQVSLVKEVLKENGGHHIHTPERRPL
ncbi:MAG: DUF3341 domain-containing protein [Chloroflexi bacterium]|nr:DUF3341 domain-containing protein [Chloroflexota bacterium]